jgi:hypothetical protein
MEIQHLPIRWLYIERPPVLREPSAHSLRRSFLLRVLERDEDSSVMPVGELDGSFIRARAIRRRGELVREIEPAKNQGDVELSQPRLSADSSKVTAERISVVTTTHGEGWC